MSSKKGKKGKGKSAPVEICGPVMRDLHHNVIMRNVAMAICTSLLGALTFYIFHNRRRQRIHAEFYENYDAEKAFEQMRSAGNYFHSAPPEDEEDKNDKKKK